MKKAFTLVALVLVVALAFTACSPAPRDFTQDDIKVIDALYTITNEAGQKGLMKTSEDKLSATLQGGTYTSDSGEKLYSASMRTSGMNPPGWTEYKISGTVDGVKYDFEMKVSVGADYGYTLDYCKLNGTPLNIDLTDIPGWV